MAIGNMSQPMCIVKVVIGVFYFATFNDLTIFVLISWLDLCLKDYKKNKFFFKYESGNTKGLKVRLQNSCLLSGYKKSY